MRTKFNEAKATQGAVRLLSLRGGKMSYMKLIKLLYLVDREALRRWGWPVTTDSYVSMDKGPVLSRVLNLINEGNDPGDETGVWSHYISEPEGFDIELKANALPSDELSVAEEKLIDEVFEQYGHMNRWALVDLLHKLPEWQDPKGSAIPIQYSDILKAVGKSEIEVAAAVAELESVSASEFLVRSI